MILQWLDEAQQLGARLAPACRVLEIDPRTIQRWRAQNCPEAPGGEDKRKGPSSVPANKFTDEERREALATVNSPEFRSLPPSQIVPQLADQGKYIGSESTLYRILRDEELLAHRGRAAAPERRAPVPKRACGPNEIWTWDITWLATEVAGVFFYAYIVVDIWSRKIVAHEVHDHESAEHASVLMTSAVEREGASSSLILHADNGSAMKGATLKATLERLGVMPSYSRPRVSNDNPFSESLFRTMKYVAGYPHGRFKSLDHARRWVTAFVRWYNEEHLHSAIGFVTPSARHEGRHTQIFEQRTEVYKAARARHPERWSGRVRQWRNPEVVVLHGGRGRAEPSDSAHKAKPTSASA